VSRVILIREEEGEEEDPFSLDAYSDVEEGEEDSLFGLAASSDDEDEEEDDSSGFGAAVDKIPRKTSRKPRRAAARSSTTDTAAGSARKANPDGVPDSFTLVGFIDDPEGDPSDSRYQVSEDYDPSLDYRGDKLQYDVWVDKNRVRSQEDLTDDNKPYVVFRVKKDAFDARNPPFSKKRDFDFAGLVIFNNGGTAGRKPFSNMPDMKATYDELYRALSMPNNWGTGNLDGLAQDASPAPPAASTPPPAAPPAPPAAPVAPGLGAVVEPAPSTPTAAPSTPTAAPSAGTGEAPAAGGQIKSKKKECCHSNTILDYDCFIKDIGTFTNIETDLTRYRRGIKKGRNGLNVHYIYDKTSKGLFGESNYILVSTAGNTLLNVATGDNIQKIVINIGSQGQKFSAKVGSRDFQSVLDKLRQRIKNVKVFLPKDDICFISDNDIQSKGLVNLTATLSESDIRRQIRNLLINL